MAHEDSKADTPKKEIGFDESFKILATHFFGEFSKIITDYEIIKLPKKADLLVVETDKPITNYVKIFDYFKTFNIIEFKSVQDPFRIDRDILKILVYTGGITDWSAYIGGVISQLAIDVPEYTCKLGAGSGTWESSEYITTFAAINGLDYIDIHSYPLTNSITDYLALMESWPDLVHNINPALEVICTEAWLYKAQVSELGGAPTGSEYFGRDVYSFWEPLDKQFFDILAITAYQKNYSIIAPFWSSYFFAYLDYDDSSLAGLNSDELRNTAYSTAGAAILAGEAGPLGYHYQALAEGSNFVEIQ